MVRSIGYLINHFLFPLFPLSKLISNFQRESQSPGFPSVVSPCFFDGEADALLKDFDGDATADAVLEPFAGDAIALIGDIEVDTVGLIAPLPF